mgnify:CR=1
MSEKQPTCVDGGHSTLHDNNWQSVQAREESDDLLQCRELRYHVQKHGDQRASAEEEPCDCSIPLSCPFRQNETLGAFASDDRSECAEDQQRQR